MEILPIWKTIEVELPVTLGSGAVPFTIKTGGAVIYEGTAYADAEGGCVVRLNDILRDYLGTRDITLTGQTYADTRAVVEFTISYGTTFKTIKVLNDWSYQALVWIDDAVSIISYCTPRWDYHTILPITVIGASSYTWAFYDIAGDEVASGSRSVPGASDTFFAAPSEPGTLVIVAGGRTRTYEIGDYCDAGALIYRNIYGGYSTLPIASLVEHEAYSRDTYEAAGNNALRQTRLRHNWRNSITRTYTLRTPVLSDDDAATMNGAAGAVQAWLYTPEHGYEAVTIRTSSWKRKTFKNEGRKRVTYDFEVEFSQSTERR